MKSTQAKRKLLPYKLYKLLRDENILGVPTSVLVRKYELNISSVALKKIIKLDIPNDSTNIIYKSYFPTFLKDNLHVQRNTSNWIYMGRFPFGEWRKECQ